MEFLVFNVLFFIGQCYIIANREYLQRVNHIRTYQTQEQRKLLEEKEEHALELLKRMLPESVAYALKNQFSIIADKFEEVSVLFTDMKGFTDFSKSVTAEQLMEFLDMMFSQFDRITGKQQYLLCRHIIKHVLCL